MIELLRNRRSIRQYLDRPIEPEKIERLKEAALRAPSSRNIDPWEFIFVDDRELLAAADLAKRNQIWDRAINTADRTKSEHDYTLRFLAPYGDQVRTAARDQALDDAWVYGLMRQESRFVIPAR